MRLTVRHISLYRYSSPVRENTNQVRLLPRKFHRQHVVRDELILEPECQVFHSLDFWGNRVAHFTLMRPHTSLLIESRIEVETSPPLDLSGSYSLHPEPVEPYALKDFLLPTALTEAHSGFGSLGRDVDELVRKSASLPVFLDGLNTYLHDTLIYETGSTTVDSTVADLLVQGRGVCQDFAHLFISLCRHRGIPARYCGGYHYLGEGSDRHENHAWAEAYLTGFGWVGWDPANGTRSGEGHVQITAGRDYADVSPVRGWYSGSATADLEVRLEMAEGG